MADTTKASLNQLTRARPTAAELDEIFADLLKQSDRGAALVGGSFVERLLELALECRFVPLGVHPRARIFEGSDAPLGSFSKCIHMGFALGIYGPVTKAELNVIKTIRNAFAHALHPLTFDHPLVRAECQKLSPTPLDGTRRYKFPPEREVYTRSCVQIGRALYRDATQNGDKEIAINLP